ncbi:NlpC/P60 family protein [Streptosporangium sp. NBC_01756]|uniref:NlpC/P60 family protein n=1 Tax=Streptosporangium sp. NBC_01756 TaxID=2975950 RepID=UPI002DDA8388|nr:NlpC/P60 family protein [Streptosporangium sp. NBC_01756]
MAEFQAGSVVVPVVPSADDFTKRLKAQVLAPSLKIGQDAGREISRGVSMTLKDVTVRARADTAQASSGLELLRREAQRLSGQSVTVSASADTASASSGLAAVLAEIGRVNGQSARVQVDADTGSANAQLALTDAEITRLDGRTAHARVDVDVAGALAGIATVTAALAAIPIAATAALGAGALGGVLASAGAGLAGLAAVAGPSLGRINEALKEQEKNALGAAGGLSTAAAATRNLAVEAAQAQIRQLQAANAADQLRSAQDRVKDAAQGVTQAKQRLSSAVAAAAQAQSAAAERAGRAERSLADAQRGALKAQTDLNKARQQAAKDLQSLAQRARGNALDQREAALDVADAQKELTAAQKKGNPEAIERASIAYERATIRVEELKAEQQQLAEEQAKGIEGNDRVVAAKEAVESANARVIDQERELAQAYAESGKAGEEAAKRVAEARQAVKDAEGRVDDAKRAVEAQKRQIKIAELQEKIRKAQEADAAKRQADAAKRAAAAAAATQAKSTQKTAELSPAEAAAAKQIKAFQESYKKFQQDLAPSFLPVITGGLKLIKQMFEPLTPLIKGTSGALVGLEKAAGKALGKKEWTQFFGELSKQAPTAITGLGKSFGSIVTGVAGVIKAFLPFVPTIVGGIEKAAAAFGTWGKNLGESQGFKDFVEFAKANIGPLIALFQNAGRAIGNIVVALAPFGQTALAGLTGLVTLVSQLPPEAIRGIAVAIGAVVLAVKTWAIAQRVLNLVLAANPIGLIVTAIGLVVGAVVAAYAAFPEFKAVVDAAIKAIGEVIKAAWENVIKPAFEALKTFIVTVLAPAITWLWNNVIVPAWNGISAAVQAAWTNVIQPTLKALGEFLKTVVGPAITWLWNTVIVPAWKGISSAVKTAWDTVIQPALKALGDFLRNTVGPAVTWLWNSAIKPAWEGIGSFIKTAWESVIQPALSALWKFVTEDIPNGFKKGVGLIEGFWNGLKDIAKKPVNFVIETVYNNGIVKLWNTVADALGLKDMKLNTIPALATGGIYPGYTPGKDIGLAAVSGGEAIMRPEWTRAVGEDYIHSANKAARKGGVGGVARFLGVAGDPGFAGGFASGGIVGDILAAGVRAGAETFLNPVLDGAAAAMGDSPWAKMLVSWPKKMVGDVITFLEGKEAAAGGPGAGKAVSFARAQIGKPYQWGGTGPDSFDCSGLVMRAWQAAGRSDIPRVSQDQMQWVNPVAKPTAGALGFPHPGHVWMYSSPTRIIEAPYTGANVREVAARSAQLVGVPPTYDNGGYLPPGESLVYNGTGRPEPVLTNQQWNAIQQGGASRGGDGSLLSINEFHATPEQDPYAIAKDLNFIMGRRRR